MPKELLIWADGNCHDCWSKTAVCVIKKRKPDAIVAVTAGLCLWCYESALNEGLLNVVQAECAFCPEQATGFIHDHDYGEDLAVCPVCDWGTQNGWAEPYPNWDTVTA